MLNEPSKCRYCCHASSLTFPIKEYCGLNMNSSESMILAVAKKLITKEDFLKWLLKNYSFIWEWEHFSGPNLTGDLVWAMSNHNIIPDAALADILGVYFANGTQSPTWYMVPAQGGPPVFAAGDTPGSHVGWTENQDYNEAARQTYTGVVTGANITNSVSPAVINITSGSSFGGSALFNSNVKGGASGIMASGVVADEGDQTLGAGGSLSMVYSITSSNP